MAEKKAHYILIVKKNQPSLHAQLKRLLWKQSPSPTADAIAGTAARSTAR
ncbi:hypothetical protein ACIBO2_28955 [Nonomuraea sp. NPDC050022]